MAPIVIRPARTRLAVAVCGLALSVTAGTGVAAADPLGPAVDTTCSYSQLVAALNAQSPATAAQFHESPAAQAWVRTFVASSPQQRQRMSQDAQRVPGAQQYLGLIAQIAGSCHSY